MKNLLILFALFIMMSCHDNSSDYHSLPECLKLEIEDTEKSVVKIGISKNMVENENLYWVFYEKNFFGNQYNAECEVSGCYGWCGLTTKSEIDNIFERNWTLIWEK